MLDDETRRAAFINGLLVAHADGVSDPRERRILWDFKDETGLSDQEAVALYQQIRSGSLGIQAVTRTGPACEMLELLARVAAADGTVTAQERTTIEEIANRCGLSAYSVREITEKIWGSVAGAG